jgi:predicted DNA-binding transcriptional regulator AlpA
VSDVIVNDHERRKRRGGVSKTPTLIEIDAEASVRELVPRLIDADQIADLMHMNKRQVYRLVAEGKFPKPSIEIGRYRRWRASDYVAFVAAQEKGKRRVAGLTAGAPLRR